MHAYGCLLGLPEEAEATVEAIMALGNASVREDGTVDRRSFGSSEDDAHMCTSA